MFSPPELAEDDSCAIGLGLRPTVLTEPADETFAIGLGIDSSPEPELIDAVIFAFAFGLGFGLLFALTGLRLGLAPGLTDRLDVPLALLALLAELALLPPSLL